MQSTLPRDSQIAIAKAISKGTADKNYQKIGLNKRNINQRICENDFLKVKAKSHKPFVDTISGPTPLIYAILCEQVDTVLYLILHLNASFDVGLVLFILCIIHNISIYFFNGIFFIIILIGIQFISHHQLMNIVIKNINIAQALIAAGADLEAKNKHKKSPISAAKLCKNVELQELIKDIQTNRIKKPELQSLINKFLPILNKVTDEEEEEEDEEEKTEKVEKKVETKVEKKVENKTKNIEKHEKSAKEKTKTKTKSKNKEKLDSKKESKDIFDINENDINPDSIETYQLILQQLNQLQQRIDCLSSNPSSNYNENDNDNDNDQIESETFDSICSFINQISDRINKLESDQSFEKIDKGQMKSLDDVLDKIQVLSDEINKIDVSQPSNLDQKTQTIEEGKKEENKENSEADKQNIENKTENTENKENVKNKEVTQNNENDDKKENNNIDNENKKTAENKKSININNVDVDTIKEEFDFDDSEEVESILVGCGAVCDVCGDPATKMCNVCKHKFCQICIGSTKHIEYHLELDD